MSDSVEGNATSSCSCSLNPTMMPEGVAHFAARQKIAHHDTVVFEKYEN